MSGNTVPLNLFLRECVWILLSTTPTAATPIVILQDEYRQIRWKGKQEKFAEAHRAELTLWDAANRYLHAHLPEGVKTLPISAWEKEYTAIKAQREAEYDTLKETRAEVAELQKIRRCVDIALRADQPEQTQSRTKRHEQER